MPRWYDVDLPADLHRVRRHTEPGHSEAHFTRAWLAAAPPAGRIIRKREPMRDTITTSPSMPSVPWVVLLGTGLVVVSALLLLAAPLGYVTGTLPLRTALLSVFLWGGYAAAAAAVVSLAGLIVTLRRPRGARRGLALAAVSFLLAAAFVAFPARFRMGAPKPPIHDISTDTQDPPQFVAVLPLRADAPNTSVYGGEKIATQQRAAYPDLQPYEMNVPPAQAFEQALAAVRRWDGCWSPPRRPTDASKPPTRLSGFASRTT